ncbi:hypothetical protein NP210_24930, partial [Salmonella enterica]|nr:hypothetical protein [Salmonella enterica]
MLVMVQCPEYNKFIIIAIIRIMDAVAWVIKYFVEASIERGLYDFISIGIMAIMFISKPIQIMNQWELISTIMVPNMIVAI